ncbi:MAG: hypothetical protein C0500_03725 [Sphingobium sp.]|nr:hypothetical protein [Sphingobium sp.]
MPTRLLPTVDDRAWPNGPFIEIEPLRDVIFSEAFDLASFALGQALGQPGPISAQVVTPSAPSVSAAATSAVATPFAAVGLSADSPASTNIIADLENAPWINSVQPLLPADRVASPAIPVAPVSAADAPNAVATTEAPATMPSAAAIPAIIPVSVLPGGPLIVQLDPVRGVATPIADTAPPTVATSPAAPITGSTPGLNLEWAPVLEAHGAAAPVPLAMFETDGDLLADLFALPPLPPITPPSGDGLGG